MNTLLWIGAGFVLGILFIGITRYVVERRLRKATAKVALWTGKPVPRVSIDWALLMDRTLCGYYEHDTGDIKISPWLSSSWTEYVVLHELGHRCHEHTGGDTEVSYILEELDAEEFSAKYLPQGHPCEEHLADILDYWHQEWARWKSADA